MRTLLAVVLVVAVPAFPDDAPLSFSLGDFTLESGQTIRNCRIAYRTAGTLNADRSNAVVVLTWFGGRTADLQSLIGAGKLFDTGRWFVISIDALGNGVSCSPSNSVSQKGAAFPRFTIRDMVQSQHVLLTRALGLERVHAVAGLSMGGMQAWQWAVSYPKFARKVIPIIGTPHQTSHDIVLWKTQLDLLERADSPDQQRSALHAAAGMNMLVLWTPDYVNRTIKREDVERRIETHRKSILRNDPYDYMSQLRAMLGHDIGGVERFDTEVLTIVALQDRAVNPGPSRALAQRAGTELVTLSGDCGHLAPSCEAEVVRSEVWRFLGTP